MDVKSIAHMATTIATAATNQAVGVAVAKKANEVQASTATALIEALPPATPPNQPEHIGKNIDTTA